MWQTRVRSSPKRILATAGKGAHVFVKESSPRERMGLVAPSYVVGAPLTIQLPKRPVATSTPLATRRTPHTLLIVS